MKYRTTAAYLSGAICGNLWMPDTLAGKPIAQSMRGPFGFMDRFSKPVDFQTALLHVLMRDGGDFQNPLFSADTVLRVERRAVESPGKYRVHIKEISIQDIDPDLVNPDAFTSDFFD